MKIRRIKTRIVDHPLRAARIVVSHAGKHDQSRFLEVTIVGNDDVAGFGEAATTPLWSGESAETAQSMVEALFKPALEGASFDHPREALALMDRLTVGNSFAKSAVDTALWDVWAKLQRKPVAELVADRTPLASVPTRASVGAYPPGKTLRIAREFWEAGIRTLKFKIGVPGIDDAARLRAVREGLGGEPIFTVDANGAYPSAAAALAAIEKLLPHRISLVEQPAPRERISVMAEIKQRLDAPLMMDEGVFTPEHLREALALDAFDALSLYPGKNGGFTRCLEMAQQARAAGKACAIGSNLETDLGQAAMLTLAASLSAFAADTLAGDLPAAMFYERSSTSPPLAFEKGRVALPGGHGFGVAPARPENAAGHRA